MNRKARDLYYAVQHRLLSLGFNKDIIDATPDSNPILGSEWLRPFEAAHLMDLVPRAFSCGVGVSISPGGAESVIRMEFDFTEA